MWGFIRDLIWMLSFFIGLGIFGGVEQGSIDSWKLIPSILILAAICLTAAYLPKVGNHEISK